MNTIIFPTDFSETASNALEYAIALAKETKQGIHLVHTYELPQKTAMLPSIERHLMEHANQNMMDLLLEMSNRHPGVKLNYSIHKTTVEQGVALQGRKNNSELVVMGTHGTTNAFKEIFMGSNALDVMNNSKMPVLLIPNTMTYGRIQKILLTMDEVKDATIENLKVLKQFAETTNAEVVALHIETNPDFPSSPPYRQLLEEVFGPDTVSFYEIVGDNVEQIIDNFAYQYRVDVICTLKRKKGFLSSLLTKSTSNQLVDLNWYPLLVLNENVKTTNPKSETKKTVVNQ